MGFLGLDYKKKFAQLGIEDTYENRRDYRNIFLSTTDLEKYVNGVILFDETARQQADDGQDFVDYLISRRIIPGIKVDQGLENFENSLETYTKGLDDLVGSSVHKKEILLWYRKINGKTYFEQGHFS